MSRYGRLSPTLLLVLSGLLATWLGGLTYFVFRSRSLLMFSWADHLGLADAVTSMRATWGGMETQMPAFLIMSAPFALWVVSYMLLIEAAWGPAESRGKFLWKWALPSAAIASEILQACGMMRGTFDANDLAALIIAALFGTLFPRALFSNHVKANSVAKCSAKLLSGSIALIVGFLVAGSEQRSNRSERVAPMSSADNPQEQKSGSSQSKGEAGSLPQQGQGSSRAGQQQEEETQNGQDGAQHGQDAPSAQGQSSESVMNTAIESDAHPQAGNGQSTNSSAIQPSTQSEGYGVTPGGLATQSGSSSPFATNESMDLPRLDSVTGGFVVTPAQSQAPTEADPRQVPQRAPTVFPDFR